MSTPPTDPDAFAEALLELGAERLEVGGRAPFTLDAPGTAWWIEAGKVEVFALPAERALPRRHHVATLEAGELLFSTSAPRRALFSSPGEDVAAPLALLAVGGPGTRVLKVEVESLRSLAREPAGLERLTRGVDCWLARLFTHLERSAAPKVFEELRPGLEVELEAGGAARSRGGVVWVRPLAGATHFLGREELAIVPGDFLLPISDETWLTSPEAARLSCVATEIILRGGSLWQGLGHFHELFLAYLGLELERSAGAERDLLARRAELDQRILETATASLASVLGARRGPAGEVEIGGGPDDLLTACRWVAEAMGIAIEAPSRSGSGRGAGRTLDAICQASRVRRRRVLLRDDWWRRDNGPLLGFRTPGGEGDASESEKPRPVALLPTSPRSYELADPATGERRPVDAELAEALEGGAYMFYPPLPERAVGPWDLLRLAFRGRRDDLATILWMGLGGGLLGTLVPILTGQIFGEVVPSADKDRLVQMTLALVVSALAAAAFQVTRGIAVLRVGGKLEGTLQAAVWDRLLSLPIDFFRRFSVGDLAERSMGIEALRTLLIGSFTTSFLATVFSLFSFALLFYYSWPLALVATALVGVLVVTTLILSYLQVRHQRELLRLQGKIASLLFGLIHGLAKLRIAAAEKRAYALWADAFTGQRRETIRAQQVANVQTAFNALYAILTSLAIFAVVGLSAEVDLPVSHFLAFNAAFGQFQAAVLSLVGLFSSVLTAIPIYERLEPLLKEVPEVDPTKADAGELAGEIELSHVSFRYSEDGPLVLNDVSFRARPGEFIALVGPSGSGKSTCLRLLLGFETPHAGSIYFDGQDLSSLDVQSVRRQIGVVLQNSRPIVGTILSNILGGNNLGLEEAWAAARLAGLEDDIKAMPMGMHTMISEGAGTFSGGQQQRLLIARAVVHRPRILLFDEATSALDNRTQEVVSQSLERLKATRIVVAHRLSTIRNADRIYVIEKGRVVEVGEYGELVQKHGHLTQLAARQTL